MKRQALITFGLLAVVVVCIVLTSGCIKERRSTPTASPTPSSTPAPSGISSPTATPTSGATELKTCAALGGYVCEVGEECPGEWLDASDTFSCCSEPCKSTVSDEGILTIEPFELDQENEILGDVT